MSLSALTSAGDLSNALVFKISDFVPMDMEEQADAGYFAAAGVHEQGQPDQLEGWNHQWIPEVCEAGGQIGNQGDLPPEKIGYGHRIKQPHRIEELVHRDFSFSPVVRPQEFGKKTPQLSHQKAEKKGLGKT